MTTNFTLRDFFVFLLTGLILIIPISILFYHEIFNTLDCITKQYPFIERSSFILTILVIPIIYLLGHFIGILSYFYFQLYNWIYKKLKNGKKIPKCKYCILIFFQIALLYRQRINYRVSQCLKENKATKTTTYFNSMEEFWTVCALLQIEKKYAPAEYWNLLNEFFNSVNLVFFISAIVAFSTGHWLIGIIYFVIAIATFYRAKQYAKQFVETVVRLMKAREELKNINYEQFI